VIRSISGRGGGGGEGVEQVPRPRTLIFVWILDLEKIELVKINMI